MKTALAIATYIALIVGTNVSFSLIGPVACTFVLAGLTMAARDFVHDYCGRFRTLGLVVIGAAVSALLASPPVALASLVAFLLAETLDLLVYTVVRRRYSKAAGVALSGTVGSVVDSAMFLMIAFGSLAFFPAQVFGKLAATLGAATLVALIGLARRSRAQLAS